VRAGTLLPGQAAGTTLKIEAMTQGKSGERERRAERLAAALKENLKRRKAQARGRAADEAAETSRAERPKSPKKGGEA
jgi:hypothetical protein